MLLPHAPYEPTPDSPVRENNAKTDADILSRMKKLISREKVKKTYYFPDMVAYMDKMVGKIAAHLEKLGLRENTLILFTGDNGTSQDIRSMLGNKEIAGGKGKTTDAGTHVPLIASWPRIIRKGKVSSDLIDFTDFLPTYAKQPKLPFHASWLSTAKASCRTCAGKKGGRASGFTRGIRQMEV